MRGRIRTRRGSVLGDTRLYWLHRVARRQGRVDVVLAGPLRAAPGGRPGTAASTSEAFRRAQPRSGVTLTDDIRAAAARVAAEARSVRIDEDAIEPYARDAAGRVAARARPRGRRRRDARRVQPAAERDQLRLRLVPDAAQAAGPLRLQHGRGGPARARALDRATSCTTITREEIADDARPGPRPRADGPLRAPPARARRADRARLASERSPAPATTPPRRSRPSSRPGTPGTTVSPYRGGAVPFFKRAQIAAADLALAGLATRDDLTG